MIEIWRDDEIEQLVMPFNGFEGMAVTIAKVHPHLYDVICQDLCRVRCDDTCEYGIVCAACVCPCVDSRRKSNVRLDTRNQPKSPWM